MFEGAKILNFTLHHIISAKGVTAAKVRGRKYIRNRSTIEFLGLGKPNITRILKWSNLTTLEKRLDYQHLQRASATGLKRQEPSESYPKQDDMVLFDCTAKQWQEANPELAKTMDIRDTATINQLIVLSNIESLNAELIKQGVSKEDRFTILRRTAEEQLAVLISRNAEQNFAKLASDDPKLIE